jgi:hypothetical protein
MLPSSVSQLSRRCESLDVSQPCGSSRPTTWMIYLFTLLQIGITKNHNAIAKSHTLQFTIAHIKSCIPSLDVAWQRISIMSSASVLTSMKAGYHLANGIRDHILLSHIRDSRELGGSPRTGWPSYTLSHWVPFTSSPMTRRATVEVFELASMRGLRQLGRIRV